MNFSQGIRPVTEVRIYGGMYQEDPEIVEGDYEEIESKLLPPSPIELDRSGIVSLCQQINKLDLEIFAKCFDISFPYEHNGEDLEVTAKMWIDIDGIQAYQDFIAIAEDCTEYEVRFDAHHFNEMNF